MKKLLLTTTLAVGALAAYGQGTINFNNSTSTYGSATPSHLISYGPTASQINQGLANGTLVSSNTTAAVDLTGLRALLYYGATTINSISGLTAATSAPATFRSSTSANIGSWVGGGIWTLQGFDVGATINAAVLVWDSNKYATGAAAYAAFASGNWNGLFGSSGIFQYTVPAAGSLPAAYTMANQQAFTLGANIPEPSTFALAGLGAAAMLIFRRRK